MPSETFYNLPAEKREQLIKAATAAFAAEPFGRVSMARLASQAGIAKGSLYQYFQDKGELYMYLVQLAADEKLAYLQRVEPPSTAVGLFPYLRWLLEQTLDFRFEQPELAQIAYRAFYGDRPLPDETLQAAKKAGQAYFAGLLDSGIAHGDVRSNIDRDLVAMMLSSLFAEIGNQLMASQTLDAPYVGHEAAHDALQQQIREAVGALLDMVEQGIGTRRNNSESRGELA